MLPEKVSGAALRHSEGFIVSDMVLGKKNKALRDR